MQKNGKLTDILVKKNRTRHFVVSSLVEERTDLLLVTKRISNSRRPACESGRTGSLNQAPTTLMTQTHFVLKIKGHFKRLRTF